MSALGGQAFGGFCWGENRLVVWMLVTDNKCLDICWLSAGSTTFFGFRLAAVNVRWDNQLHLTLSSSSLMLSYTVRYRQLGFQQEVFVFKKWIDFV